MTRKEIEERACEILQRHGLLTVPVDPVTLANREGILVHNAVFSESGISGMVARRGASVTMLIDQQDPPFRKRFSIAHELGHHFLHLTSDGEIVTKKLDIFRGLAGEGESGLGARRREVEANQFAAALLMPDPLVREAFSREQDVESLARLFNVSGEAMGYRLAALRLV